MFMLMLGLMLLSYQVYAIGAKLPVLLVLSEVIRLIRCFDSGGSYGAQSWRGHCSLLSIVPW